MTASDAKPIKRLGRAPTIRDVAKEANVSIQTISRVINNSNKVAIDTRARVLKAIEELGYHPNSVARSLVTRHSLAIGLVLPDISQPFYPMIARGVEDGAQTAGYSVFLCNAAGSPRRELEALERLRGHQVAGQIICNSRLDDASLAEAISGPIPVVMVNRRIEGLGGTVISTGYRSGSETAVSHLLQLGRTNIGVLRIDPTSHAQEGKFSGYLAALGEAGIRPDDRRYASGPGTLHGGYQAMETLMRKAPDTDAIFAFNDQMAVGALRYASRHGIRVPDDVAVVGFGGAAISEMTTPPLTTVAVPLYDIGAMAIRELLDQIETGVDRSRSLHAPPVLRVRESTIGRTTHHEDAG